MTDPRLLSAEELEPIRRLARRMQSVTVQQLLAHLDAQAEALAALRAERAEAMALLNPVASQETLAGAIRNLQQAHVSERDNAEQAEAESTRLRAQVERYREYFQSVEFCAVAEGYRDGTFTVTKFVDLILAALALPASDTGTLSVYDKDGGDR